MILKKIAALFFISGSFSILAQLPQIKEKRLEVFVQKPTSKILRSSDSDTSFLFVEMKGAQYDGKRNKLPFFSVSNITPYDQSATALLQVKKTLAVVEPHASIIRKYFQKYLGSNFELETIPGLSRNENLNLHRLIPFRINSANQVEELLDYEITWQVAQNSNTTLLKKSASFKTTSVLASGDWYKMAVTKTGIHKIDKTLLEKLGIPLTGLDPRKIQLFGNGGKMVPELNGKFRYDDLEENDIQVVGESDGVFDDGDYILFYATGTDEWRRPMSIGADSLKFEPIKNLYSDSSFYFITIGTNNGKRVTTQASSNLTPNVNTDSYDYYAFHEEEKVNFGKTGRAFFGEYFDFQTTYGFSWSDGDFVTGDSIGVKVSLVAAYPDTTQFLVSGNGLFLNVTTGSLAVGAYLADYAVPAAKRAYALNNDKAAIIVSISKLTAKSIGWLDKVSVNARRNIILHNNQFQFRDTRVTAPGKICRYNVTKTQSALPLIWNVSDPIHPFNQNYNYSGNTIDFVTGSTTLNEYCISPETDFYLPNALGKIENQNLHGILQADYVIVTHPLFYAEALRLAAFHNQMEGYTTAVATTDKVYNEFSSGQQDVSAIRDFIRMIYSRGMLMSVTKPVKYALLMGDGSYINRVRGTLNNSNYIPTYQTLESLSTTSSLATDDFYGLMDADEGEDAERLGSIDVGIGRFTCRTVTEVQGVIGKIENYYKKDPKFSIADKNPQNCSTADSPLGDWRNNLLFLADDGDQSTHMKGADNLSNVLKNISSTYNADKIYLDAYQRISTPGGQRYPDATEDYKRRIKKGVLVFNYTGHGGEVGLTAERILDIPTINAMDNINKLPLFVTATCEFSRYDDPGRTSAGELCLLNSKGAAIALLTTCRLAYSSTNDLLNSLVIEKAFRKLPDGTWPTLGDIIRMTKAAPILGGQEYYYANFHLLGDPALKLAYPEFRVNTSKVNNQTVSVTSMDTLNALAKITVSGYVSDTSGNKLSNFNGLVYSTVFDKEQDVVCLLNDPSSYFGFEGNPFKFKLQRNILFRGKSQVTNGDFTFTFIVPKDISFALGPGKISYYATNGTTDANGYYDKLIVGGGSGNNVPDSEGPKIDMYLNDKNFVSGGITNEKPVLYADITDSSGINTLGSSIGHDITALLGKEGSKPIILNDYYEADLNSYQSGRVRYPFEELSEGEYHLTFKVWDIQNNSGASYSDFVVAESAELALKHVLNYPNPFTTQTKFFFEHNQACAPIRVNVQIYTISGKTVKTIQQTVSCEGYKAEGISWDGRDEFGDKLARGVYIYKLSIISMDNQKAEKIEKLVILN